MNLDNINWSLTGNSENWNLNEWSTSKKKKTTDRFVETQGYLKLRPNWKQWESRMRLLSQLLINQTIPLKY